MRSKSDSAAGSRDSGLLAAPGRLARRLDFGGLLLVIFIVLAVSGCYLAAFYQPYTALAWNSIAFIDEEVPGGGFIRSLHRWSAFLAVLLLIFHTLHMLWSRAYRKRTWRWFSGLLLLLFTLAFVVSGYIVPWDFRAYWTTLTMGNWLEPLPLFSGALDWLLHGRTPGGAAPLARWFALHAAVLPLLTVAALAVHILALRRPLKLNTAFGWISAAVLLVLAGFLAAYGIQKQDFADPVTTSAIPQPEWLYFIFFQVTRYMQNNLEMLGVFWLPMTVTLCLCLLPLLDKGWGQWFKWSLVVSSLSLVLTLAVFTHRTGTTTPVSSCLACHKKNFGEAFSRPPDLLKDFSRRYDNKWLAMHYRYPQYFWMMDADIPAW